MKFIDEKNDLPVAVFDFFQNGFQTFLKFTTVFGACYQCPHIQSKYDLVFQAIRHIPAHNTLCQSLYSCRLTYTGFTDENRIIFGLTR